MELTDSESRTEWFNRCCELQNALGGADRQLKVYEETIVYLQVENAKLKEEIDRLTKALPKPGMFSRVLKGNPIKGNNNERTNQQPQ